MLSGGPACFPDCCGSSSHEGALPASSQQPELRSTVVQNLQSCMRKPLGFMGPAYGSRAFRGSLLCLNAVCRLSRLTRMIRSSACHLSQHRLQGAHQPQKVPADVDTGSSTWDVPPPTDPWKWGGAIGAWILGPAQVDALSPKA